MTNADQPQDITARLDDINVRLEALGDELDLVRTVQDSMRREVRYTNQSMSRLERTVADLADIARDHQQALRLLSQNAERDRETINNDRAVFQAEIRRIWEYLLRQGGNGNSPV
ncbi:hypothetical protein NIES4071_61690 [Calothrix sp. NIES-4071]|nr:hypothetical protein NIES4071_61690 [Calothrix sp. NIES-4071]BAZ60473.1 hypothetical protein NIES4105_61640 [Calothrix sp. NIES-4105]